MFLLTLWLGLEIASLYFLGVALGGWTVAYIVLVTGFLGFSTLSRQGRALASEYGEMTKDPARFAAKAQTEGQEAIKSRYAEGMLGMLSGLLLMVPGALSDLAGLLLQIPALRRRFAGKAGRFMETLPQNPKFQSFVARQGGMNMPGGFGPGMPGPGAGFGGGGVGHPSNYAPSTGQASRGGAVIDTTASDS